jgi:hypothetical protein
VVRLESSVAGRTVAFEEVEVRLYQDWKDQTMQQLRTDAVRKLGQKYTVVDAADVVAVVAATNVANAAAPLAENAR